MKSLASNITLDGNMPDAKEVATTQYIKTQTMPVGPAMPDLMQVQVQAGRWYLIDATPPRNFLNGGKAVLAGTGPESYDARKKKIFKDMTGIMAKVGTEILNRGGNDEKLRTVLKDKVTDEASKIFAPVEAIVVGGVIVILSGGLVGVIATSTAVTWNAAVVVTRNDIISHISTMDFKPLVYDAEKFFNDNIDYALDNNNFLNTSQIDNLLDTKISSTTDDLKASLYTRVFKPGWNNDIRYIPFENALKAKIAEMANGISTSLVKFNTGQMLGFATSYLPNSYLKWNVMARNINRWSNEFTYQGDRYQMKDVSVGADYTKTVLDIQDIIGIGIASTSRYQHYRKEYGGELAAWYGDVSNPENWDMGIGSNPNPANWQDLIDGHGYVDGTTNFYMLAKVGIKKTPTDANFTQQYAALWLDEQEYFSERWRIIHPLDNAFEGLAGTITAAYPVMAWFNGISLLSLASEYGTPYENLTSNARMATAGTATVIADDDKIYSATYYYSLTDRTWRWRAYPKLAAGATINKKSVKMREDLTIYFEGSKIVNGTPIAGYWYQPYLGSNSLKDQQSWAYSS